MVKIIEILKIINMNYTIYKENKNKFYVKKLGMGNNIKRIENYIAFNIFFTIMIVTYVILGGFYPDFFL